MFRNKIFLLLCLLAFSACKIISFQDEDVSCSLAAGEASFSGQQIQFSFSSEPDHYQAEQCISLKADSKAVEVKFNWNGTTLCVQPAGAWEKGKNYHLSCNGTITINTSRVSVSIERTFLYGNPQEQLVFLKSQSILSPSSQNELLTFSFNKPLEQASFTENFSISPSIEKDIIFSEENKTVQIKPKEKWAFNTLYTWSFKNIKSSDGYFYKTTETQTFSAAQDNTLPELLTVCPVRKIAGTQTFFPEQELDSNIKEQEAIGLIFSKPMNFDSVKSGLSITPSVSGYLEQFDEEGKLFVYIPTQMYSIKLRYEFSMSAATEDIHALTLYEEKKVFFTPDGDYLTLQKLSAGAEQIDFCTEEAIPLTLTKNLNGNFELTLSFQFSTQIEKQSRSALAKQISLSLLFPLTSESPVQTQIRWNSEGTILSLTWENFTASTASVESFYKVQIPGTSSGINNGRAQFMEKDISVILKPQE